MSIIQIVRSFIVKVIRRSTRGLIRLLNRLLKFSDKRVSGFSRIPVTTLNQEKLVISASKYNMFAASGEDYYSEQYWQIIEEYLPSPTDEVKILDLGSGQGRMVQKILDNFPCAEIRCCDISSKAIRALQINTSTSETQKVMATVSNYDDYLREQSSSSFDIVLFTEVSFYSPGWEESLPEIQRVLRPGGVFVSSHRSRYFNAMVLLSLGHVLEAKQTLGSNSGRLFGTTELQFSWNDSSAICAILKETGFSNVKAAGIGVLSGIKGDPHEFLAEPGKLSGDERIALMELEKKLGETVPDAGRYVLFIATKE